MPSSDPDVLRFDLDGVGRMRAAAIHAGTDLLADHRALTELLTEATTLTGRIETDPLPTLGSLRRDVDEVAADVTVRALQIASATAGATELDALTARINRWPGSGADRRLVVLRREQRRLVDGLGVGPGGIDAVIEQLDRGATTVDAVLTVAHRQREATITDVMDTRGLSRDAAIAHIERLQDQMSELVSSGLDPMSAIAAVSITDRFDIDMDEARSRASTAPHDLLEVIGHMALARGMGLPVDDVVTIDALRANFAELDRATDGWPDGRVSIADLEFVRDHPRRFAPAQVSAATTLLSSPALLDRLDTASADAALSDHGVGTAGRSDGLISVDDLRAFVMKAQISHSLADHATTIDVAADPGGEPDGFVSEADLKAFVADTPDLAPEVRSAATAMLESGMYDQNWLDAHQDELVTGAAVVAGAAAAAVVITATAGTAAPIVVTGAGAIAGAAASGATTVGVNALDDDRELLDGFVENTIGGAMLGATTAGLPLAFKAAAAAPTVATRVVAAAEVVSDAASITWAGGFDILLPESIEDDVHAHADVVARVAGPVAALRD